MCWDDWPEPWKSPTAVFLQGMKVQHSKNCMKRGPEETYSWGTWDPSKESVEVNMHEKNLPLTARTVLLEGLTSSNKEYLPTLALPWDPRSIAILVHI